LLWYFILCHYLFFPIGIPIKFEWKRTWGRKGKENGEFIYPSGICCDNKHVIVCDDFNHRLQIFDLNGNFIRLIKCEGSPLDVNIFNNLIYVTKSWTEYFIVFTFEGNLHSKIILDKQLYGICINSNFIFISHCYSNEISCYSHKHKLLHKHI